MPADYHWTYLFSRLFPIRETKPRGSLTVSSSMSSIFAKFEQHSLKFRSFVTFTKDHLHFKGKKKFLKGSFF